MNAKHWTEIPHEELTAGDTLCLFSRNGRAAMVLRIDPYNGPFADEGCFGIAVFAGVAGGESGMTLWTGQRIDVLRP